MTSQKRGSSSMSAARRPSWAAATSVLPLPDQAGRLHRRVEVALPRLVLANNVGPADAPQLLDDRHQLGARGSGEVELVVEHGGAVERAEPDVRRAGLPAVQDHLVLVLVVGAAGHEAVLHPDQALREVPAELLPDECELRAEPAARPGDVHRRARDEEAIGLGEHRAQQREGLARRVAGDRLRAIATLERHAMRWGT